MYLTKLNASHKNQETSENVELFYSEKVKNVSICELKISSSHNISFGQSFQMFKVLLPFHQMIKYVKWTFFSKDKEPAFILFQGQNIRIICFQKELPNINFVVLDMNIEQKIIVELCLSEIDKSKKLLPEIVK